MSSPLLNDEPPAPPVEVGTLVAGRYRVKALIAWGGMGVVFSAQDEALQRKVALKVVRRDFATSEEAVGRFLNEARAAATLKSEHIAHVLDVGQLEDGLPFMVMEHLDGADLSTVIKREGLLPVDVVIDYVLQACEGLAEAHKAGIIHRDLKPENLFVSRGPDGSAVVKVLDFGISKRLKHNSGRSLTNPASSIGSPLYMSPEQMKDPSNVDTRADVWSIGAVLFELLSGHSPFEGDTVPEICAKVLSQPPPTLREVRPELSEALEQVVLSCLEKDPERRPASVALLASSLEPFGPAHAPLATRRIALISGRPSLVPGLDDTRTTDMEAIISGVRASDRRRSGLDRRRFMGRRQGSLIAVGLVAIAAALGGTRFIQVHRAANGELPPPETQQHSAARNAVVPVVPPPEGITTPAPATTTAPETPNAADAGAPLQGEDDAGSTSERPSKRKARTSEVKSGKPPAGDERFPTEPRVDTQVEQSAGSAGSAAPARKGPEVTAPAAPSGEPAPAHGLFERTRPLEAPGVYPSIGAPSLELQRPRLPSY